MDDYWKKIGEEIKERKKLNIHKQATTYLNKIQHKVDSGWGESWKAKSNKQRWPKGISNVFNILIENRIRFVREKVVGLSKTFRQIDFSIPKLKIFIEIDGPEHTKLKDTFREHQIKSRDPYKQYTFFRIKSDAASDYDQARIALKPIIDKWNNTLL